MYRPKLTVATTTALSLTILTGLAAGSSFVVAQQPPICVIPIKAVEFTQAIQSDPTNGAPPAVKLMTGRQTVARVYIDTVYAGLSVDAWMQWRDPVSGSIIRYGRHSRNGPITIPSSFSRSNEHHTLNFLFVTSSVQQTAQIEFVAENISSWCALTPFQLFQQGMTHAETVEFFPGGAPRIVGFPVTNAVPLTPGQGAPQPPLGEDEDDLTRRLANAHRMAWAVWPFAAVRHGSSETAVGYNFDTRPMRVAAPRYALNSQDGRIEFLEYLESTRRIGRSIYGRADAFAAWIRPESAPNMGVGETYVPYRAFLIKADFSSPNLFRKVFAHELGHALPTEFEEKHNSISPDVGWDPGPWMDRNLGELKPSSHKDIMVQAEDGAAYSNTWIGIESYNDMFNKNPGSAVTISGNFVPTTVMTVTKTGDPPLWSFGEFTDNVENLSSPPVPGTGGAVEVRILDNLSNELYDTTFDDFAEPYAFIEVPTFTNAVRFELYWNGQLEDALVRTSNTPVIAIASPQLGATLDEHTVIQWQSSDGDGDNLSTTIVYSHNEGVSELVLGTRLPGSGELPFDPMGLPSALDGKGRLRIKVSDGLNTTIAEVGQLNLGTNHPPVVEIGTPGDGDVFRHSAGVLLHGSAADLEDEGVNISDVQWFSSIDGFLGSGPIIDPLLSAGVHTISLQATDEDGATSSTSISVTITPN